MVFLDTIPNGSLSRTMAYPDKTVRLDRDTLCIIPTDDEEIFYKICDRLKFGPSVLKIRLPKSIFVPKLGVYKVGATNIRYNNSKINDDLKIAKDHGYSNSTYVAGAVKDFNVYVNTVKLIQKFNTLALSPINNLTRWKSILSSHSMTHLHKYVVFTPDNALVKITSQAQIFKKDYKSNNLYINFLYNFLYNYEEFKKTFDGYVFLFTDYKITFRLDLSQMNDMKHQEIIGLLFKNLKYLQMGVELVEGVDPVADEVIDYNSPAIQAASNVIDNVTSNTDTIKNEALNKEVNTILQSDEKTKEKATKIEAILAKSVGKQTSPLEDERLKRIRKKQEVIQDRNLTEILEKLESTAEYVLTTKTITNTANKFNKFSIYDMDSQYEEIAAKDRLAIGESFSTSAIPLYLTNYNEKIDMDSTDTKCKIVKFQFESPHNDADKYSFSMRVPELRDGKFLHLNGSDKVMIRQKLAKPIIKLTDSVAFTTYYNKMFIVSTNGNLNKRTSKIKKYMKYIRKNYSNLILGRYFDFTPGYFAHRQKNILGPELLELSRYFSIIKLDDNNYIDLSFNNERNDKLNAGSDRYIFAVINNFYYACNPHDDIIEMLDSTYDLISEVNILDVFENLFEMNNDEVFSKFNVIRKSKGSDNIIYSHAKLMNQSIPLLTILLQVYESNLKLLLDRLVEDYNLEYKIILTEDKSESKIMDKDDVDNLQFENFILQLKYNNTSNRTLLAPLLSYDLEGFDSLVLNGIIEDTISSSNLIMYMENFRDLFIDPITKSVMVDLGLPDDYAGALIYCNHLLFNYDRSISDISLQNERMPANSEIIQGVMYKVMADAFVDYSNKKKRGSHRAEFSVERDAIINYLNELPNIEESSKINPVQHLDKTLTASNKGISGVNNSRSYTIPKRMWDESFYGVFSDTSPYNASTGISKHLSVNPNITDIRGYFKETNLEDVDPDQIMSVSESLGTFSQRHDSSPRTAMGMQQFNHLMGVQGAEPALVTYGMDESLSHLDSDFCHKVKMDGEIIFINDRYIKVKYTNGEYEVFAIDEVERNSSKAFYIPNKMKLNSKVNLTVGAKLKKGTIVAYNENVYKEYGDDIVFMSGPIVYVALANTKYSYEDAILVSQSLADKMAAKTLKRISVKLKPGNKIAYSVDRLGEIKAGDDIFKYSEDTGTNFLSDMYDLEELDDFLLKVKKSNYNGEIKDIYVYYKLTENEFNTMDPSIKTYMDKINKLYKVRFNTFDLEKDLPKYEQNRLIEHVTRFTDNRKNKVNGDTVDKGEILIEYFIEVEQNFSIGDKLTVGNTALKGIVSKVIDNENRPTGVESGRSIDALLSPYSPLSRMVYSLFMNGILTECMIKINDELKSIVNK